MKIIQSRHHPVLVSRTNSARSSSRRIPFQANFVPSPDEEKIAMSLFLTVLLLFIICLYWNNREGLISVVSFPPPPPLFTNIIYLRVVPTFLMTQCHPSIMLFPNTDSQWLSQSSLLCFVDDDHQCKSSLEHEKKKVINNLMFGHVKFAV